MTQRWAVLDIEVDGEPWAGEGLCVGWGFTAHAAPLPEPVLADLADPCIAKVVWTKFDHRWLRLRGIDVRGPIHDAQVMAWLLDEAQDLSLEVCAKRYLDVGMDKRISPMGGKLYFRTDGGKRVPLGKAPRSQLHAYCERDLEATSRLYVELTRLLREAGLYEYFLDEMVPFTGILADMEARGVPVDIDATKRLSEQLHAEIDHLEGELLAEAGLPEAFNLGSAQQLGKYLYTKGEFELPGAFPLDAPLADSRFHVGRLGRVYAHGAWVLEGRGLKPPGRTECGQPTVAAPKLRAKYGSDPWIARLLELKQRQTIVANFLDSFPSKGARGRLYGRFNQTGTVTGRLSSNGPNLQNIPARTELGRRVRELFRSEPGTVFVHGDYSQLEPRIMAHFSGDQALLEVYRWGNGDVYADMALGIWGASTDERRTICKTLVLALSYGAGAAKIAQTLTENGHPTKADEAEAYLAELQERYRTFFGWREYVIAKAGTEGYVPTIGGRKRRVKLGGAWQHWKDGGHGERQAVNAVVQGSAADIVARVMVYSAQAVREARLLVQVHDELLWEADEADGQGTLEALCHIAERGHGFELDVPLEFKPRVVSNWAEGKA